MTDRQSHIWTSRAASSQLKQNLEMNKCLSDESSFYFDCKFTTAMLPHLVFCQAPGPQKLAV